VRVNGPVIGKSAHFHRPSEHLLTISTRRDHNLAASLHDLELYGGLVQPCRSRPRGGISTQE
jgi:hypothetical protein